KSENPASAKFCIECGATLARGCLHCTFQNPAGAKFCQECGAGLASSERSSPPKKAAPPAENFHNGNGSASSSDTFDDGERKTVTVLFADIKGSMDLIENLDPEEARGLLDPALRLMIEAVQRYEGYVAQSTGDGVFALFGAP